MADGDAPGTVVVAEGVVVQQVQQQQLQDPTMIARVERRLERERERQVRVAAATAGAGGAAHHHHHHHPHQRAHYQVIPQNQTGATTPAMAALQSVAARAQQQQGGMHALLTRGPRVIRAAPGVHPTVVSMVQQATGQTIPIAAGANGVVAGGGGVLVHPGAFVTNGGVVQQRQRTNALVNPAGVGRVSRNAANGASGVPRRRAGTVPGPFVRDEASGSTVSVATPLGGQPTSPSAAAVPDSDDMVIG